MLAYGLGLFTRLGLPCIIFIIRNLLSLFFFFFSSRRRHTRSDRDWSLDVCSSDLGRAVSPLDMATAYATLADSGTRCDPKYVSTATDGSGRPMNLAKTSCRQVLDPRTADTVKIGRASCRERV